MSEPSLAHQAQRWINPPSLVSLKKARKPFDRVRAATAQNQPCMLLVGDDEHRIVSVTSPLHLSFQAMTQYHRTILNKQKNKTTFIIESPN